MADNEYVKGLRELQNNLAVKTLMHVVPWAEGSVDNRTSREQAAYRLFGFNKDGSARFAKSLNAFPDDPGYYKDPVTGQVKTSSDAGLYQLNKMNIPRLQKKIGRTDFSPETQDLMFLALMDEQPGFRNLVKSGDPKTWTEDQWKKLFSTAGRVYNSFPNGPGSGAKRSEAFLFSKANEYLNSQGIKPVEYTGPSAQTTGVSNLGTAGDSGTFSFMNYARANQGMGSGDSYLTRAMQSILSNEYADSGRIPFKVYSGKTSVFGNVNASPEEMVNRLFDNDPNTQYGLSFVGSSLRPTVSRLNPDGQRVDMIELPNGTFVNAATGEHMNADGTVYEGTPVEYLTPDYEAPQNSPEAMEALRRNNELQEAPMSLGEETVVVAPDRAYLDHEGKINPTAAETALPTSNTPLTTNVGSAASPTAYVDPNMQVVNALGGDTVTRTLNASRPVSENIKELLRLA